MSKIFSIFIECVFWIVIFLSPVIIFSIAAAMLFSFIVYIAYLIVLIGLVCGVFCAEYIRRRYGTSNFIGNLLRTKELEDDE